MIFVALTTTSYSTEFANGEIDDWDLCDARNCERLATHVGGGWETFRCNSHC